MLLMIKRIFVALCLVLAGIAGINARTISEVLSDSKSLTPVFVSPLGLENVMDISDMDSLQVKAECLGLNYKVMDLGQYGKVMSITPEVFEIAGVPVDRLMIMMTNGMNGLVIQSAKCDNCRDMSDFIDGELVPLAKKSDSVSDADGRVKMLTDEYGVATGVAGNSNTAIAILMEVTNLKDFLSLRSSPAAAAE